MAQVSFNSIPPGTGIISNNVSPGDTALSPLPTPRVQIQFAQGITGSPQGGVNVFDRIIGGLTTEKAEFGGRFIFPPGGSFVMFLSPPRNESVTVKVAFAWWEDKCAGQHQV